MLMSAGCTDSVDDTEAATVSVQSDSEYVQTFKELQLGTLADFTVNLPRENEGSLRLWVERYQEGKIDPQPVAELSFDLDAKEAAESPVGFGMIDADPESLLVFLYGPGVKTAPEKIENFHSSGTFFGWEYALGDEPASLKTGETIILGAYRQSSGNSIQTYDLQSKKGLEEMVRDDRVVLVLKMEIF